MKEVEGPPPGSSYTLTLGARYTSTGSYDKGFSGNIAAVVLQFSAPPAGFASCVVECLESMSANTTGTDIVSLGFDESTRTLSLVGNAPDYEYQKVLQTVMYINRASEAAVANVKSVVVAISDGFGEVEIEIPVNINDNSRRRREAVTSLAKRRLTSIQTGPTFYFKNN